MAAFKTGNSSSSSTKNKLFLVILVWGALVAPAALAESNYDLFPLLMPKVMPTHKEAYLCTPIKMSEDETYYVKGFQPNATGHTAHHMLIYGCDAPGSSDEAVWNCGEMASNEPGLEQKQPCASKPQIIYAWAMDAPMLELPEGVAFRLGHNTDIKYLVLQVHYAALDAIPPSGDDSGVFLEFSRKPEPKAAGVYLMGTGGLAPPHSTTFFETACEIQDERPIHPFAFRVHTHALGKVVSGWRVKDGSEWSLIGKQNPQLPEMFYPVADTDMVISKKDFVAARCTMVNHGSDTVYIGTTKADEMCNFYIMYWVDGGKPVSPNTCFTQGPPLWSWGGFTYGAGLVNIPEEEASTL